MFLESEDRGRKRGFVGFFPLKTGVEAYFGSIFPFLFYMKFIPIYRG